MIWTIFVLFLGLTSARNVKNVQPQYLEFLRATGQHEEFARLLGVDVSLVHPSNEERSESEVRFNNVSPLGDILLPDDEQERNVIRFNRHPSYRWPNRRIPYRITPGDFSQRDEQYIHDACAAFNNRCRNLKLVRHSGEADYVQVMNGNGCWSYIGRIGGQQGLSLQRSGCLSTGTIQHEFMHAAGFAHEQNREDRDNYVTVLWDNIPRNWWSQYEKSNPNDYTHQGLEYDHYSVMHYPIWAPDSGGKDAFRIPSHIDRNGLGNQRGVTDMDVQKVNRAYA